jgi:predicted MFS family arabinose efflux permease
VKKKGGVERNVNMRTSEQTPQTLQFFKSTIQHFSLPLPLLSAMANQIFQLYRNAFGGLSQPVWILALTMFINRSGAMVLPFLGVYLSGVLGFSLRQAGLIMGIYGLGSIAGAFIGGWFTDRFGHFHIQYLSLIIGGFLFFIVSGITDFHYLAAGIFILSMIIESLRPANSSSVAHYARPENITRAFSLNRMAINLGFSVGPAVGGLLASLSYTLLFYVDGLTCIFAGLLFFFYFRNRKGNVVEKSLGAENRKIEKSPFKDWPFLLFILFSSFFAILFLQFLFTLPLYYRDVYLLSEKQIGGLIALNGFIVFLLEMVIVYKIGNKIAAWKLIIGGMIMLGFSFSLLNLGFGMSYLIGAMIILSVAEIFVMPYQATVTVKRAGLYNRGAYMGLFTLSYSIGFVLAPVLGTMVIDNHGFNTLWWLVGIFAVFTAIGYYFTLKRMKRS